MKPYKHPVDEVYNIQQGDEVSIIENDLFLDSDAVDAKIAISYALAQAVKLKREDILSDTMPDLLTLPSELAKKIGISKKKALKKLKSSWFEHKSIFTVIYWIPLSIFGRELTERRYL